jgi:hypothetical protein
VVDNCSFFIADPSREQIERCNAFFGPFQAGIKNATGVIDGHDYGKAESGDISDFGGKSANKKAKQSEEATTASTVKKSSIDPAFAAAGRATEKSIDPASAAGQGDSGGGSAPSDGKPGLIPDVRDLIDGLTGVLGGQKRQQDDTGNTNTNTRPTAPTPQGGTGGGGKLLDFLLGP